MAKNYFNQQQELANKCSDENIKKALTVSKAWFAIDILSVNKDDISGEELARRYADIAKIISGLLDDNAVAIFHPESGRCNAISEDVKTQLRSENPLKAFTYQLPLSIMMVKPNDEIMDEAIKRAKNELPQFIEDLQNITEERAFILKVKFTYEKEREFMWVEPNKYENETFTGILMNTPNFVKTLKAGDTVTVKKDDIIDFMYKKEGKTIGGYTQIALKAIYEKNKQENTNTEEE